MKHYLLAIFSVLIICSPFYSVAEDCVVVGCSGTVCIEESAADDIFTTCEMRPEYRCYSKFGICEKNASGRCGWTKNSAFSECFEKYKSSDNFKAYY